MTQKVLIYSPFIDWRLVSSFEEKTKEIFRENNRFAPDGFKLSTATTLQQTIKSLDFAGLPEKLPNFYHASGAFSAKEVDKLASFVAKNKISLHVPNPVDSPNGKVKGISVAAVMELEQEWPKEYGARKEEYEIEPEFVSERKQLHIRGYRLTDVRLSRKGTTEKGRYYYPDCQSAKINLVNDLLIILTDLSFYAEKVGMENNVEKFGASLKEPIDLLRIVEGNHIVHDIQPFCSFNTYALLPNIEEECSFMDNLKGMSYFNDKTLNGAEITSSGMLSKLRLNEKGVYTRSEGHATGYAVIGCSVSQSESYTFALIIKTGLVINIRFRNKPVFLAFIPQSCFHRI